MDLPLLIPVPPSEVRKTIPNEEWEATLDAWILLTELRLHLPQKEFGDCAHADQCNASFLASYFLAHDDARLHGLGGNKNTKTAAEKARRLRRTVFLLTRRYYLDLLSSSIAEELLDWRFLSDFCDCYHSSSALKQVLPDVWQRHGDKLSTSVEDGKTYIMKQVSNDKLLQTGVTAGADLVHDIRRMSILASMLSPVGNLLMTGSDYLDFLQDAYRISLSGSDNVDGEALRKSLVANAYVGLTSLLKVSKPNLSLLLDHLFTLKVAAGFEGQSGKNGRLSPGLLSDLVCSTDILVRIERYLISAPQKRGQDLAHSLRVYQQKMKTFHHQHYQRRKIRDNKGKGKGIADDNTNTLHAHKLSMITQIRDLFPDLGAGYVVRLLDYYGENVEGIVAHLLEDTLAPELEALDKAEPLPDHNIPHHDALPPNSTPPQLVSPRPEYMRNIDLEDDEIIRAAHFQTLHHTETEGQKKKQLLFGRANIDSTADSVLADRSQHAANKAAILSALANFDSDDDERDDTYDIADVGGTVDAALTTGTTDAEGEQERRSRGGGGVADDKDSVDTDMTLYRIWKSSPAQFGRDSATRRSQPRTTLKRETGMTDEAIEGWALMLQRDTKKQSRLEGKLAFEAGMGGSGGCMTGQPNLPPTAYRRPNAKGVVDETEDIESDVGSSPGVTATGRGRGGRGRGGGPNRGGGRGGGRGRGANHRRRDQHAKKMARAGALPS